jgi:hypothetical protein
MKAKTLKSHPNTSRNIIAGHPKLTISSPRVSLTLPSFVDRPSPLPLGSKLLDNLGEMVPWRGVGLPECVTGKQD